MGWPSGDDWTCRGFAAVRYLNAYAAFMALGLIAFNRQLEPLASKIKEKFHSGV